MCTRVFAAVLCIVLLFGLTGCTMPNFGINPATTTATADANKNKPQKPKKTTAVTAQTTADDRNKPPKTTAATTTAKQTTTAKPAETTKIPTQTTAAESADTSGVHVLNEIRTSMRASYDDPVFAVIYAGTMEGPYGTGSIADWVLEEYPEICMEYPFIMEIDRDAMFYDPNDVYAGGDIFCIIPKEETYSVTVNSIERGGMGRLLSEVYSSDAGDPILICANNTRDSADVSDLEVIISDGSGIIGVWMPKLGSDGYPDALENPYLSFLDFTLAGKTDTGVNDWEADLTEDWAQSYLDKGWFASDNYGDLTYTKWKIGDWEVEFQYSDYVEPYIGELKLTNQTQKAFLNGYWSLHEGVLLVDMYLPDTTKLYGFFPILIAPDYDYLRIAAGENEKLFPFMDEKTDAVNLDRIFE